MRAAPLALLGIASLAYAGPPPGSGLAIGPAGATRKTVGPDIPEGMGGEAIERFAEAIVDDEDGRYEDARRSYESSLHKSDQAITHYNLADVLRRAEHFDEALTHYEKYLELAPKASDRAAVQKLVDQLKAMPSVVVFDGVEPGGVLYVDGVRVGVSPLVRPVAAGRHIVERIGAQTYDVSNLTVKTAKRFHERLDSRPDKTKPAGNVSIASNLGLGGSWTSDGVEYKIDQRFTLPAGHYSTPLLGRASYGCSAVTFDVAPAPAFTHVFISGVEKSGQKCVEIKVRAETVDGITVGGASK